MGCLWRCQDLFVSVKIKLMEVKVAKTVLYGSWTWVLNARKRKKTELFDVKYLRRVLGIYITGKIRDRDVK